MTRLSGLTIVLPCLDDAESLAHAVRQATEAAERLAAEHEIVIVDDGGTDEAMAAGALLAARDPRVRLVFHTSSRGSGHAVRSGIAAARQPWVLVVDDRRTAPWRRFVRRTLRRPALDVEWVFRLIRRAAPVP